MQFKTRLKSSNFLIDLTPLVDVIFLLLIFFIFTSDILPLKSLPIESPKISKEAEPLTTQLFVVMDRNEVIYVGSKRLIVDLHGLEDQLTEEVQLFSTFHQGVKPTIVLSIDKNVPYDSFLKLFSIAQNHSSNIRLAYETS